MRRIIAFIDVDEEKLLEYHPLMELVLPLRKKWDGCSKEVST